MHMFYTAIIIIALIALTLLIIHLYNSSIIHLYSWVFNVYLYDIPLTDGVEKQNLNNEAIIDYSIDVTSQNGTSFKIYKPKRIDINSFSYLLAESYQSQYEDNHKMYYIVDDIYVSHAEIYRVNKHTVLSYDYPHSMHTTPVVVDFDTLYRKVIHKELKRIRKQVKYEKKQRWEKRKKEYKEMKRQEKAKFKKLLKQEKENE